MLRVIFRDGSWTDYDANAAAPFGHHGVLLSKLSVRSGVDPSTMQRIEQVTNPQLGHVAPQLVIVLADYAEVRNLEDPQFISGEPALAFAEES